MLVRELKLKLNKNHEQELNRWLLTLQSVYNWAIRRIELNAQNKIYFSQLSFRNSLPYHGKKLGIPSHVLHGVLDQAHYAWQRCFKKISKKPRFKSARRSLRSISFPDPFKSPAGNRISIPGLKKVRFFKQDLPEGVIKRGRIVKRASGWYLQLTIDTNHVFPVKETNKVVGIDTGFKSLLTLSNGEKFENPRELRLGALRLAQAQRSRNKKLVARLQERNANRRKDRNHKISRALIENYSEIYVTNDNPKGQAKRFGKSVAEASISQLKRMLTYKSDNTGRLVKLVDNKNSTRTCSNCGALTGPSGLSKLAVRTWECSECCAKHDRDINAAINTLLFGLGWSLESNREVAFRNQEIIS